MMLASLPWWARAGFLALFALTMFAFGVTHGERRAGQKHIDYVQTQAQKAIKIVQRQQEVVTKTEVKVRERVRVIYKQGEEIEKQVPVYITSADNGLFGVNVGFVRIVDAAWSGEPPEPASESDRESSRIPLATVAQVAAHNATSCRQWREQALEWRVYYEKLQKASK